MKWRFGPSTEESVKIFQKAHDLVQDGIVGPKTNYAFDGYELDKNKVQIRFQVDSPSLRFLAIVSADVADFVAD